MSHQPERKEKDCLNCGTIVQGRYCHVCGQENIVTKESFWALLHHFIADITHFDTKFFETLGFVLFRPGYLSKQYVAGKRASFLNPIRMYLFTSAIFFLIFFSFKKPVDGTAFSNADVAIGKKERLKLSQQTHEALAVTPADTTLQKRWALLSDTTREVTLRELQLLDKGKVITFGSKDYTSPEAYDSIQKKLPAAERDGWLKRIFVRKGIMVNEKYGDNTKEGAQKFFEIFLHKLPYLLFFSLPFFALILKLLYVRHKDFYYSDHVVFTLHHYIFSFLLLLVILGVNALINWIHYGVFKILLYLLIIAWPVYLYKAMRNFYQQSRAKTISKFLLLNILGFVVLVVLLIVFFLFAFLEI